MKLNELNESYISWNYKIIKYHFIPNHWSFLHTSTFQVVPSFAERWKTPRNRTNSFGSAAGYLSAYLTCDIRGRGTYVTVLTSFRKVRRGVREGARVSPHLRPRLRVEPRSRGWWWRMSQERGCEVACYGRVDVDESCQSGVATRAFRVLRFRW